MSLQVDSNGAKHFFAVRQLHTSLGRLGEDIPMAVERKRFFKVGSLLGCRCCSAGVQV